MLTKNYWIILALIVFIKLLRGKRLSSYNIKWLIAYTVYVAFMQAEYDFDWDSSYFFEEFVWLIFLIPLCLYFVFSICYKKIQNLSLIKWADSIIDKAYNKIKDLC